jgi:hypothetical protein
MFEEKDSTLTFNHQDYSAEVIYCLINNNRAKVKTLLKQFDSQVAKMDKALDYRITMKEIVSAAYGIVAVEYDNAGDFVEDLLNPLSKHCILQDNPMVRYYTIESVVNLILILRENIFCKMWDFLLILLEVTFTKN